ncbi:MAG: ATP-binding protein [Pirellulales bacterium]
MSAFSGSVRARFECAGALTTIIEDCVIFSVDQSLTEEQQTKVQNVRTAADTVLASRKSGEYFRDFTITDLETVLSRVNEAIEALPEFESTVGISEDSPDYFDIRLLPDHLERIATEQGGQVVTFLSTLRLRLRGMIADQQLGSVIGNEPHTTFEKWLHDYIGGNEANNGPLAIIDLSLVPSEVIHVIVAVLSRLVFEALQRYRREHEAGLPLPTVLVLEEAHTFIRKTKDDEGAIISAQQLCRESFERIAREGRKFGLGLVLSSQRPFELSPTVLAQCNTFLLHRIVNDSDQSLVAKLVPDNVAGLLAELPSLPSRQAILLGWATPIPVLVDIDELPKEHRPNSSDPDFWKVWTRESERKVDWDAIAKQWRRQTPDTESTDSPSF